MSTHPDTALLLSRRLDALTEELKSQETRARALSALFLPQDPTWLEITNSLEQARIELAAASAHLCLLGRGAQSQPLSPN